MTTTTSTSSLVEEGKLTSNPTVHSISDQPIEDRIGGSNSKPQKQDIKSDLGLNVIWLDHRCRKMGIGIMGIDRNGIIAHVTERLRDRGLNIDAGFGALIEVAAGAFFEISGNPITMREMFDEIVRNRHPQFPLIGEPPSIPGMIHELKVIAPDRPGIVFDISKRLRDQRIKIDQLVIRTERRRHRGIVYGRLEIPSDEACARFLDSLRDAEGYHRWRIKCQRWKEWPRQDDSLTDTLGMAK